MAAFGAHALGTASKFFSYSAGPRIYKIFSRPREGGRAYEPHIFEWFGDTFLKSVSLAISVALYGSPIIVYYVLRKGMITTVHLFYMLKFCSTLVIFMGAAHLIRGIGRLNNRDYENFLEILEAAKRTGNRAELQKYDFEFSAWPVDFEWSQSSMPLRNRVAPPNTRRHNPTSAFGKVKEFIVSNLQYVVAHTLGRPMAYPGSVKLLQSLMANALLSGRSTLIEQGAQRAKLLTKDGIEIDSVFLDRRGVDEHGYTLVICSEGNAGFYEVGCTVTPLRAGYSVMGWNHPGFGGSSGKPSPDTIRNAIDTVVHFAVSRLGFTLDNIIIFAWSIGGFPASYAAMTYPEVKALILDATFDNVVELGKARMPASLTGFVEGVVKNYFNLDIAFHIRNFPGPIRFIRRLREEIITTIPGELRTNRINYLLVQVLSHRYPKIMTPESIQAVEDYLAAPDARKQDAIVRSREIDAGLCSAIIRQFFKGQRPQFPSNFGEDFDEDLKPSLAICLTRRYMIDFDATHCTPLPSSYFQLPWDHEG